MNFIPQLTMWLLQPTGRVRRASTCHSQRLAARFVADVVLPLQRVAGGTGHHDFYHAFFIILMMPLGPQFADGLVNLKTNPAAHAHDHGLAVHDFEASLPMLNQILGYEADALVRTDNRFERRP